MLLMCCCHQLGNYAGAVLSLPGLSRTSLFDVIGSSGIVRSGFRDSGAALTDIIVQVVEDKLTLLMVAGRKVLLFFINSSPEKSKSPSIPSFNGLFYRENATVILEVSGVRKFRRLLCDVYNHYHTIYLCERSISFTEGMSITS